MTKSQDNAAVVLRKTKQNKTPQIKFSYTSVSRLHVSHLSIIYRRPQRAVAELVLAGGSKLRSRRRGGSRWSVTVRVLVLKETQRAGGGGSCYSVLVTVKDFLAGPLLPRACDVSVQRCRRAGPLAATSLSLRMWSQSLFSKFSMDGAVESKQNFSQSPRWMVVVVGRPGGVFSLLTLEDQAAEHLGSCQESPRPWPRPLVAGERHENSWSPGSSGQFPRGFPGWSGSIGLHVWQCGERGGGCGHPGNAREPSGLGETRSSLILGSQDLHHPGPPGTGVAAPCGTGRLLGTDPETNEAPFTSSGPGRWHTPSAMARAWGLAAWGPG